MSSKYFIGKHIIGKHFIGLALGVICSAQIASAQATRMAEAPTDGEWMTGDQIIKEYTDSTQTGMYSYLKNNAPVSYTEIHYDNTITLYNEYGREDFSTKGVWVVKKNIICYYYSHGDMNPENCFNVLKSGNCYYHYSSPRPQNFEKLESWNSVGYDEDVVPTCVPPIT